MLKPVLAVISDVHVGAGALDDCDAELENCLVEFLHELARRESAVELVINGDFLDFVQAEPWQGRALESVSAEGVPLCFTQEQSVKKLEQICCQHKPVFKALEAFLAAKPDNKVTILPGNHDADFFWTDVRALFVENVCGGRGEVASRLQFHLEQIYRPPGFPEVWIEHGHQYDPLNAFFVKGEPHWHPDLPPIFRDVEGQQRLYECTGTRFLIKFLNHLDAEYPFVDNVKPFSRFIAIFGASTFVRGYGPLKAAVAVVAMLRYLSGTLVHRPGELLKAGLEAYADPRELLSAAVEEMSDEERKAFTQELRRRGFEINRHLKMYVANRERAELLLTFLAENLDILDGLQGERAASLLGTSGGRHTLALASGFSVDETAELKAAAEGKLREGGAGAVIMGHTHEPVNFPPGPRYINTGSWTRYYRFADEERLRPWSFLKSSSYETFPYQLNYAEVVPGRDEPVRLVTFRERSHD